MRRMKSGVYSLVVPIYEQALYVALSPKAMEAEFGEPIGEDLAGEVGYLTDDKTGRAAGIYICLRMHDMNTVSHECVHVAFRIMESAGITPTAEEHEALAYLVGWLVDVVREAIERESKRG